MKPAAIDPPEISATLWEGFHGDVGWDVGANCGQTIRIMLERFRKVFAFEPAAECWPYLDAIHDEHPWNDFAWYPAALSDHTGDLGLLALPDKIDTGQLVTAGTCGMEWNPNRRDAYVRTVRSYVVDHLVNEAVVPAPDFMKIDTEGHEQRILFGARQTLAKHRPALLVEFHSPELHFNCQALLEQYGYTVETVRHPHYQPGTPMFHQHGWLRARQ